MLQQMELPLQDRKILTLTKVRAADLAKFIHHKYTLEHFDELFHFGWDHLQPAMLRLEGNGNTPEVSDGRHRVSEMVLRNPDYLVPTVITWEWMHVNTVLKAVRSHYNKPNASNYATLIL